MKTKLVYVLTCAPEANYIEQALMSVWSARHWNPDAHIVLITDNLTDKLFVGKRAEILDYISEKIVVPFEDDSLSMVYRSRWLKTSVRQLIKGDFLFIDCDTIVCKSLVEVDSFDKEICAVRDSNVDFKDDNTRDLTCSLILKLEVDANEETFHFNSGVMFVKDSPITRDFYDKWHQYWIYGSSLNVLVDQPALAKTDIEFGHLISCVKDQYNSILHTQDVGLPSSLIFHLSAPKNTSLLYTDSAFEVVKINGLTSVITQLILNVHSTYLPFDFWIKHSSFSQRLNWIRNISKMLRLYGQNIDSHYCQINFKIGAHKAIIFLLRLHLYRLAMSCWMIWKRMQLKYTKRILKPNICLS